MEYSFVDTHTQEPRYLFHISHSTNPYNTLETKVIGQLKCCDASLLKNKAVFVQQLTEIVQKSNESYRCKPLQLISNGDYVWIARQNGTYLLTAKFITVGSDYTFIESESKVPQTSGEVYGDPDIQMKYCIDNLSGKDLLVLRESISSEINGFKETDILSIKLLNLKRTLHYIDVKLNSTTTKSPKS